VDLVTGYRVGDYYTLDRPKGKSFQTVTIRLRAGSQIRTSAAGERVVYHGSGVYGVPLDAALKLGWCEVVAAAIPCSRVADRLS
jgi:hypothetical protein